MKLLWLDLNSSYAHSSLALPMLHAQCDSVKNVDWSVYSGTINEEPGLIAANVALECPDIIAATCWSFTHSVLLQILGRVKVLLPDVVIILGGPEFLGDNRLFCESNRFIDCVFRGEGEEFFKSWLSVYAARHMWNTLQGLCYIDGTGSYHDQGMAKVSQFKQLVSPFTSEFFSWNKPFVQLETTRGCFNTCSFCVSGGDKPVRKLELEEVYERLVQIHSAGIRDIRLLDRTFNYNDKYANQLLDIFCRFPDMHFHLEIHPALLSPILRQRLSGLPPGMLHLEAGIQSLREHVLNLSLRKGTLSDSLSGLSFLCALQNIEVHVDLIAGLPGYKLNEIFSDIYTLASYGADEIQLESLKVLPGTDMRKRAETLQLSYSPFPPYEVLRTPDISPSELQTARLLSRMLDLYYNTKAWHFITRTLICKHDSFLYSFLNYLINRHMIDQSTALDTRGIILYEYCKEYCSAYTSLLVQQWIEGGFSLKKLPAEDVRTRHIVRPDTWEVLFGEYSDDMKLCKFESVTEGLVYWYAFKTSVQNPRPCFKAISRL